MRRRPWPRQWRKWRERPTMKRLLRRLLLLPREAPSPRHFPTLQHSRWHRRTQHRTTQRGMKRGRRERLDFSAIVKRRQPLRPCRRCPCRTRQYLGSTEHGSKSTRSRSEIKRERERERERKSSGIMRVTESVTGFIGVTSCCNYKWPKRFHVCIRTLTSPNLLASLSPHLLAPPSAPIPQTRASDAAP